MSEVILTMGTLNINLSNLTESERQELIKLLKKSNDTCNNNFVEDDIFNFKFDDDSFYIETDGSIYIKKYQGDNCDEELIKNNNLCKSDDYMKKLSLQQILYRKLKQYSYQHGGKDLLKSQDSSEQRNCVYYIYAHKYIDKFECEVGWDLYSNVFGVVYFRSGDVARQAIDEVVKPFLQEHNINIEYLFD